jgi:ribosome assembly protein YihI (activator of Der GTPase)
MHLSITAEIFNEKAEEPRHPRLGSPGPIPSVAQESMEQPISWLPMSPSPLA